MEQSSGFLPILTVLIVVAVAAVAAIAMRGGISRRHPVKAKRLLTDAEIVFFRKLIAAVDRFDGLNAFPQVAMGAIVTTREGLDPRDRMAMRGRFDRKIVDFVIVDDRTDPVLIVELDDSTHDAEKDKARDRITGDAGIPTLRMRNPRRIDVAEIERAIRERIA